MKLFYRITLAIILTILVGAFFSSAVIAQWSDSELWAIGLAKTFSGQTQASVAYKFLFNAILSPIYFIDLNNVETVQIARILFGFIGLAIAGLVYTFSLFLSGSRNVAIWCFFLFISSSIFQTQGFRVRSDLVASFFQMLVLTTYIVGRERIRQLFLIPLLVILSFGIVLATPKGVYHLLLTVTLIYILERKGSSLKADVSFLKYFILIFILPFIPYILLKWSEFSTAFDFYLKSFLESDTRPPYLSILGFEYIFTTLYQQALLILILVGTILLAPKQSKDRNIRAVGVTALLAVALMCLHNDRLPFFIFSLSPLPVIYIGLRSHEVWKSRLSCSSKSSVLLGLVIFFSVSQTLFSVYHIDLKTNNYRQKIVQELMEKHTRIDQNSEYYDATIALPRNNSIYIFPAPEHKGNSLEVLNVFNRPNLALIFFGNRLHFYLHDFYTSLEKNFFIQIGKGVFAKAIVFDSNSKIDSNAWNQICSKFGNNSIYAYQGNNFLTMKVESTRPYECSSVAPVISNKADFLALTPYGPFNIPNDLSFAQIFDSGL